MKLVYLPAAIADIAWMRRYYARIFPEGQKRAREHFRAAERLLSENPRIGRVIDKPNVRELVVARTPFSFIYRVNLGRIEVLRVWDNRAGRALLDIE